jgi:predicted acylesterase/phospholipase RssA
MRATAVIALVSLAMLTADARGEEAIVLSGGGSRGLAHAGALVGVERRGHDPGIVVGSSMGSIVGALYAAGFEPDSIWQIVTREDWRGLFGPFPIRVGPERDLRHPVLHLQNGRGGTLITRGYVAEWRINRELVRKLFPAEARSRGDFDRLPRRYRAIAADVDSGTVVPLGSGDLARAVRASMAASGFFSPVRWGNRYLFDGGIGDYLPVVEARRLGADSVIAVDVLRPPAKAVSLDALALAQRTIDLLTVKVRSGEPEVLVLPKLDPSLSPYTYPVDPTPLLDRGLEAALAEIPTSNAGPIERPPEPPPDHLTGPVFEPTGSPLEPFLKRGFRPSVAGTYDSSRVFASVDRLYATGDFDGVWPSVEARGDSSDPVLVLRAETKGSLSLAGAPGFDNDRGGRIWAALRKLSFAGEIPITAALEGSADGIEQWGAATLRVASLSKFVSAWTAGAFLGEKDLPFLVTDSAEPEVHRAGGWLGAEWMRFEPDLTASVGFSGEDVRSDLGPDGGSFGPWIQVGELPPLVEEGRGGSELEAKLRFGEVDYWRARVRGSFMRPVRNITIGATGDLTGVAEHTPLDEVPSMGEEHLLPALRWGEHRGRLRAVLGFDGFYRAALGGTLRLRFRGGALVNELEADGVGYSSGTRWLGGAALSVYWWSFLGKLEAGLEAGTLGDRRISVDLGTRF